MHRPFNNLLENIMGRPPNVKKDEPIKAELKRVQIKWKNIHTGTGVKLLKGMILELEDSIYDVLQDTSKEVDGYDIDAIKLVDNKKALTHKIVAVAGRQSVVEI